MGEILSDVTLYRSVVGALQYFTLIKPKISFIMNKLCWYIHQLKQTHWIVAKFPLQYLQGTMTHGLMFQLSHSLSMIAYTNACYTIYNDGRHYSRKQKVVSRSSTKAKFRALSHIVFEMLWIQKVLTELKVSLTKNPLSIMIIKVQGILPNI